LIMLNLLGQSRIDLLAKSAKKRMCTYMSAGHLVSCSVDQVCFVNSRLLSKVCE
jgi:hypothetical protein